MKKKESTKKRFFEGSALGSALRMTKRKGLAAIVISLLFALVLSACSVVTVDSNKPIEGSVGVTSETKNGGQTLPFTLANLGTATNTYNYAYTGGVQTLTLKVGCVYKFEVWGAQGGASSNGRIACLGGYSIGFYSNAVVQTASIFIGGAGTKPSGRVGAPGGYNGGGRGVYGGTNGAGGGGGMTDIRLGGVALENQVIVAGGSGGAASDYGNSYTGAGGGVNGGNHDAALFGGRGGTQTAGGVGDVTTTAGWTNVGKANGSRGLGGTPNANNLGDDHTSAGCSGGGGGGGGYYGGGGGAYCSFGGGGSGYIGGVDSLVNSAATMSSGIQSGNGKAVITEYAIYTLKSPSYLNKERLTSFSIPKLDVATESISTTTALTFNNTSNLYLDNTGTTAATDYFTVTGTADNLTVTPKVSIESRTFYAYMKSNTGALVYAPITISTKNDLMIMKS